MANMGDGPPAFTHLDRLQYHIEGYVKAGKSITESEIWQPLVEAFPAQVSFALSAYRDLHDPNYLGEAA